jgi:hypothetical protein
MLIDSFATDTDETPALALDIDAERREAREV